MKRYKNLVIGGIQSKVFNLILVTTVLLTAAYMAVSVYHSNMLSELAAKSGEQQQETIAQTTEDLMEQVVSQTLMRSNQAEARIANEMFEAARNSVAFLSDYAEKLFAYPDNNTPKPYAAPDPKDDGVWTAKVIFADGVDASSPEIASKLGLLSNMSDMIISLCTSTGAANAYIALPEGAHLSVSDTSTSWYVDGRIRSYDPRTRGWYQQAAEAGRLIFTDGEWDANTGAYCIECAMPVYGPDGSLQAVAGMDLFLDEMQAFMLENAVEGEYLLLVNQAGCAVLEPQEEAFPLAEAEKTGDLRKSPNSAFAKIVSDALKGNDTGVAVAELAEGAYYITATPIETTGWILISAYSQALSNQPTALLVGRFAAIQGEASADYLMKTGYSRTTATVLLVAIMLLTLGGAIVLGKRIVRPLNTITQRIAELREGDLEFKMEDIYRTGDEVEELAESFAAISHRTVEYLETVKQVTAEKERIGTELSLATQIQAAMLPHVFPPFPDRPEFDVYASMDPAKEVGGDFYDYFLIDEDHLGLVIADVSGKGVPAALFMMASKIILQSVAMLGRSPGETLTKTNEAICSNNEAQMFVTVWFGILELSTGKMTCANAGHENPALKRKGGNYELYRDHHGLVIGGMEGVKYKEYVIQMEPGTKLFVYTDGVPEATNAQNKLFGTDRMLSALNDCPDAAPRDVLKNVRQAVDRFVKDAEQFDDLTMLCLEYKGTQTKEKHPL